MASRACSAGPKGWSLLDGANVAAFKAGRWTRGAWLCCNMWHLFKGLRPLPPTPADSRIFGFFDFSEIVDFWNFPVGFGVWEGLQWIGNGCGLQMDGFLSHFVKYESILNHF